MGLDTVELILEVEEAFEISIPDEHASRMLTVGDLHDFILAHSSLASGEAICLSAFAYRRLLRAAESLGSPPRLRPREATIRLFPEYDRRRFWNQLSEAAQLKLPALRRPRKLVIVATIAVLALGAAASFAAYRATQSQFASLTAFVAASAAFGSFASALTASAATQPSDDIRTLRGLARAVVGLNFHTLRQRAGGAQPRDLWDALRAIIVEQLGVPAERVTRSASFVNDLGCG